MGKKKEEKRKKGNIRDVNIVRAEVSDISALI